MTTPDAGYAVLPSGSSWVVGSTSDGFAHVANRTPAAVETEGGVVAAASSGRVIVAVGAHERLLRSPILTSRAGGSWRPDELTAAVANARSAVGVRAASITAVTAANTVLAEEGGAWRALTVPAASDRRLDAITWATPTSGWLTAHGATGSAKALRTVDGGRSWQPVAGTDASTVAALAPCGRGAAWQLPIITAGGDVIVLSTADDGRTWARGHSERAAALPVWGCHGTETWLVARVGDADHLLASGDAGRTWRDRGPVPAGLTDLAPIGGGRGYAVGRAAHNGAAKLWMVSEDGRRFTPRALPSWVATLGVASGGD